jgi:type II secretory pathway component PulF
MMNIQKTSVVASGLCGSMFAIAYCAIPHFTTILDRLGVELPWITASIINIPLVLLIILGCCSFAGILLKDIWLKKEDVIFYNFVCVTCTLVLVNIFWYALWRIFFSVSWQLSRD